MELAGILHKLGNNSSGENRCAGYVAVELVGILQELSRMVKLYIFESL